MPALAPETQPAVVLWARSGAASLESVPPGCVEPRGQTSMGDGSVEDGRMDGWRMGGWTARRPWRRGRGVGPAPGMARNGRRPRRRGTALVCGWRWDPALVFLVARLCPGVFWSPGGALAPVPRPLLRVLAGPSPPLPAFPPCPVRATACVCPLPLPFPAVWGRAGLASRGCRLPASVGRWRPRVAQCPRSPPERGLGRGVGEPWRTVGLRV